MIERHYKNAGRACFGLFTPRGVSSESRMGSELTDLSDEAASKERLGKENLGKVKNLVIADGGLPVLGVSVALPVG